MEILVSAEAGDTVSPAVPITARKRKKSTSRRVGQNGTVEERNGAYRGRWFEDVAGQSQRVKRSVVLGFVKEMRKSEAPRKLRSIIEATGAAGAGELYGLEVADIDFARNTIHVRRSVWEGQKQSTKSRNANRAIDVQPSLVAMLEGLSQRTPRRFGDLVKERKAAAQQQRAS
jgi:integrase